MTRRMSEIFDASPEAALDETFKRFTERATYLKNDCAFMWTSTTGIDGVRYGSFKYVYKQELQHRKYIIEFIDYAVSIYFTDVLHHPRLHRDIPKDLM